MSSRCVAGGHKVLPYENHCFVNKSLRQEALWVVRADPGRIPDLASRKAGLSTPLLAADLPLGAGSYMLTA